MDFVTRYRLYESPAAALLVCFLNCVLQWCYSGEKLYRRCRRKMLGISQHYEIFRAYLLLDDHVQRCQIASVASIVAESRPATKCRLVVFFNFGERETPFAMMMNVGKADLPEPIITYSEQDVMTHLQHRGCETPFLYIECKGKDVTDVVAQYYGPKRNLYSDVEHAHLSFPHVIDINGNFLFDSNDVLRIVDRNMQEQDIKVNEF